MDSWLQRIWYARSLWAWLLFPLSLIFALVANTRTWAFRVGLLRSERVSKPVIIVGNITVGGTGKTPIVIWLAEELSRLGCKPAVITRGYGGRSTAWPVQVYPDSDPALVGDEAVLIAQRSSVPVFAGPNRLADARAAIEAGAQVIISDDGLQHYRLARDMEIAVIDGERVFGNGLYLPAGPLRESPRRLSKVQAVLVTQRNQGRLPKELTRWQASGVKVHLRTAKSLTTLEQRPLRSFAGTAVHAVAAIGNPAAFFAGLAEQGLQVAGRALADHAPITAAALDFDDGAPVFMTEKDAVKCRAITNPHLWSVPIELEIEHADQLLAKVAIITRQ